MWRFYELYPLTENLPQVVANFEIENLPQVVAISDDYKKFFLIPWGHHKVIVAARIKCHPKVNIICQGE